MLLVLVHGGMFVTGSPRAGRHLAARLSTMLGVTVATPALRLAPEHPYPAALDDLTCAYSYLSTTSVGGLGSVPSKMAIFAESSGGALALSMLSRQAAASLGSRAKLTEPSAIVLASPWLDMTCSGNSCVARPPPEPHPHPRPHPPTPYSASLTAPMLTTISRAPTLTPPPGTWPTRAATR